MSLTIDSAQSIFPNTQIADAIPEGYKLSAKESDVLQAIRQLEGEQLAPEQWVKLYGVAHGQCSYIVTCQVWQVMEIFGSKRKEWQEDFFVTPVEKIANRSLA